MRSLFPSCFDCFGFGLVALALCDKFFGKSGGVGIFIGVEVVYAVFLAGFLTFGDEFLLVDKSYKSAE